jgi:phage tail sheath gpL-like
MSNIKRLPPSNNMTVDQALSYALGDEFQHVIITGYNQDGDLNMLSSHMTKAEGAYLLMKSLDCVLDR